MVLSTQALLIAVGVNAKRRADGGRIELGDEDGVGQLGGVIFASHMGKGGMDFDYWRQIFRHGLWQENEKHGSEELSTRYGEATRKGGAW
ncbi:hypothetical protein ACHAW5_004796 [Stephanodiscus triporus]|uniref:Uncharacterized protein n=1 Tax=Stephanodiscus triporus TaxID=2934178 RepID=A0ABD3MLM2_9STRA